MPRTPETDAKFIADLEDKLNGRRMVAAANAGTETGEWLNASIKELQDIVDYLKS